MLPELTEYDSIFTIESNYNTHTGKRSYGIRQTLNYFPNKDEAENFKNEIIRALQENESLRQLKKRIEEFVNEFDFSLYSEITFREKFQQLLKGDRNG